MPRNHKSPSPGSQEEEEEEEEAYEVEKIVDHTTETLEDGRIQNLYKIRWKGYSPEEDTYEPGDSLLPGAEDVLKAFIKKIQSKGVLWYPDGTKASKIAREAKEAKQAARQSNGGASTSHSKDKERSRRLEQDDEVEVVDDAEEQRAADKKRKKRESAAAAAKARDEDMAIEEAEQRPPSSKRSRRTSDSPLPPPLSKISRREKENEQPASAPRKSASGSASTSSKRNIHESDDDGDAAEIEQIKRSPLKEKKAEQASDKPVSHESARKSDKPVSKQQDVSSSRTPLQGGSSSSKVMVTEEAEMPLTVGSTLYHKEPIWEALLKVESLEQDPSREYRWFVRWNDEVGDEWIPNTIARKKFPQRLLDFYQDHLKFKSNADDDDDAAPVNGADDGMDQD